MLIVANWKAYVEDWKKATALTNAAKRLSRGTKHELVLAPPSPLLGALSYRNRSKIAFAAQDVSATTGGAATGEATAGSYRATGADYAIVGHSERRAMGETDEDIGKKLAHALAHGLTPILCIGERERDGEGRYLTFIREQLTGALSVLMAKERTRVIVAYEPVWAIGKTAAEAIGETDLVEMVLYIKKVLAELLPGKNASHSRVLYGGSVEPGNIRDLAGSSGVDGFLIGHASVDARLFSDLVRAIS